jgi:hypothetical protein
MVPRDLHLPIGLNSGLPSGTYRHLRKGVVHARYHHGPTGPTHVVEIAISTTCPFPVKRRGLSAPPLPPNYNAHTMLLA